MYNTGIPGFLTAASNPNRYVGTAVTLKTPQGNVVLTPDDIVSYKILDSSVAGKYFIPGNFVAATLEVSFNALSPMTTSVDFKTVEINSVLVEAGISVEGMTYVPMGVFYLDNDGISMEDDGYVTIKASNLPPVMSNMFNSSILDLPCTIREALDKVSVGIGIPIHVSSDLFPNLSVELTETFELSTTYRETLRYIAETLGACVKMGRDGEVYLEKVFKGVVDIGCTLDENYLFSVNRQESMVKPFQHISIKANTSDLGVTKEVDGVDTGKEYAIYDNPLTYGHPEDFLDGLVQSTSFTAFHPAKIEFHGRPDIDTGDVLQYVHKGVTYLLPVCIHTFEYNGGFKTTIEGIGTDALEMSPENSRTDIKALKQNINSLIRDLTKTQSEIVDINGEVVKISSILQTAEQLQSQISAVEKDVSQLSTLTQTADQLRLDIQTVVQALSDTNKAVNENQSTLLTYFDFQADGLTIGLNTSNVKLRLSNNRIQFLKDGTEVAYLSDGQLYVTDAYFIKTMVLGNFEFTPRNNGNLSLRRRG